MDKIQILYTLLVTHVTIICVTLYLHRGQAHKGITFHPILSHFMRFWLWMTSGITTKNWVAIHRKHHRFTDKKDDPHSPVVLGIAKVFFGGYWLYAKEGKNDKTITQYGKGTPDDWIERNVYTPHDRIGLFLMLAINILLFKYWGILIWVIQILWIPIWAAGFINGVGHWFGYRNGESRDQSKNILPFGIIVGGEELHNNHHLEPASVKLSRRWFEIDIGYFWLRLFILLKLAKINNSSNAQKD
jgi:stearoyl-CoA desaturase (Delta-9 desaturase)